MSAGNILNMNDGASSSSSFKQNQSLGKSLILNASWNDKMTLEKKDSTGQLKCATQKAHNSSCTLVEHKCFKKENHFYPKVQNAKIHPIVASFFKLGNEAVINRYKQANPNINAETLRELLSYKPKYFKWAGKLEPIYI